MESAVLAVLLRVEGFSAGPVPGGGTAFSLMSGPYLPVPFWNAAGGVKMTLLSGLARTGRHESRPVFEDWPAAVVIPVCVGFTGRVIVTLSPGLPAPEVWKTLRRSGAAMWRP